MEKYLKQSLKKISKYTQKIEGECEQISVSIDPDSKIELILQKYLHKLGGIVLDFNENYDKMIKRIKKLDLFDGDMTKDYS